MNAVISTEVDQKERLLKELSNAPAMEGLELASKVSTKEAYTFGDPTAEIKIAALDLGIKTNILHNMADRGMFVKVFPYNTSFETMELLIQMVILFLMDLEIHYL